MKCLVIVAAVAFLAINIAEIQGHDIHMDLLSRLREQKTVKSDVPDIVFVPEVNEELNEPKVIVNPNYEPEAPKVIINPNMPTIPRLPIVNAAAGVPKFVHAIVPEVLVFVAEVQEEPKEIKPVPKRREEPKVIFNPNMGSTTTSAAPKVIVNPNMPPKSEPKVIVNPNMPTKSEPKVIVNKYIPTTPRLVEPQRHVGTPVNVNRRMAMVPRLPVPDVAAEIPELGFNVHAFIPEVLVFVPEVQEESNTA